MVSKKGWGSTMEKGKKGLIATHEWEVRSTRTMSVRVVCDNRCCLSILSFCF